MAGRAAAALYKRGRSAASPRTAPGCPGRTQLPGPLCHAKTACGSPVRPVNPSGEVDAWVCLPRFPRGQRGALRARRPLADARPRAGGGRWRRRLRALPVPSEQTCRLAAGAAPLRAATRIARETREEGEAPGSDRDREMGAGLGFVFIWWGLVVGVFFFFLARQSEQLEMKLRAAPPSPKHPGASPTHPTPHRAQRRTRSTHPFCRIILFHHSSARCAGGRLGGGGAGGSERGSRQPPPGVSVAGEYTGTLRLLLLPPLRLRAALQLQAAQPASEPHPQPAAPRQPPPPPPPSRSSRGLALGWPGLPSSIYSRARVTSGVHNPGRIAAHEGFLLLCF